MVTGLLTFAAFFSFGYCITDIVLNWRSAKRLDEMLKEIVDAEKD